MTTTENRGGLEFQLSKHHIKFVKHGALTTFFWSVFGHYCVLATVFRLDLCFSKLKCFAGKTSRGIVSSSVSSSAGNVVFRDPPTNM